MVLGLLWQDVRLCRLDRRAPAGLQANFAARLLTASTRQDTGPGCWASSSRRWMCHQRRCPSARGPFQSGAEGSSARWRRPQATLIVHARTFASTIGSTSATSANRVLPPAAWGAWGAAGLCERRGVPDRGGHFPHRDCRQNGLHRHRPRHHRAETGRGTTSPGRRGTGPRTITYSSSPTLSATIFRSRCARSAASWACWNGSSTTAGTPGPANTCSTSSRAADGCGR